MTYEQIKKRFDELVAGQPTNIFAISNNGLQNACKGALAKAAGGDENRKLITKALIGKTSSKDFTLNEWYALFRFVFPVDEHGNFVFKNPVTDKWEGRPELEAWCGAIFTHIARQQGQMEMFVESTAGNNENNPR
ncbi:MAG: hypothetical protein ACOY4M_08285 [Pseudomonadota bacterium]